MQPIFQHKRLRLCTSKPWISHTRCQQLPGILRTWHSSYGKALSSYCQITVIYLKMDYGRYPRYFGSHTQ